MCNRFVCVWVWVCQSVKSSFCDWCVCVCMWVQFLCANSHVGNCFDQSLTNEIEQDKRQTHAENGMGFVFVTKFLTLPRLRETQNRHVEVISGSYIEKVHHVYKMTLTERGRKEWVTESAEWVKCACWCVCVLERRRMRENRLFGLRRFVYLRIFEEVMMEELMSLDFLQ